MCSTPKKFLAFFSFVLSKIIKKHDVGDNDDDDDDGSCVALMFPTIAFAYN